jgi:hypothetical protein
LLWLPELSNMFKLGPLPCDIQHSTWWRNRTTVLHDDDLALLQFCSFHFFNTSLRYIFMVPTQMVSHKQKLVKAGDLY